ncbi:MAG TPA: hypothetical protein VD926_05620, partial [Acidimicrobiales bacterium]|nr:hypothetical protein [Acidimicrobiales bacterium]
MTVLLGTTSGVRTLDQDGPDPLAGRSVNVLAPAQPTGYWALVESREVWRLDDGDAELAASIDDGPEAHAIVEHQGRLWVGTAEARLLRLDDGELVRVEPFEHAPGHEGWHTPWGGPPTTYTMTSDGERLYVNVHVGGILVTDDGGESWAPTIPIEDDVHQVSIGPDGRVWAATGR